MPSNNCLSGDLLSKEGDFYRKFRARISEWEQSKGAGYKWIEYVVLAPDLFHLLVKLSLDRNVPAKYKALLVFAVGYFLSAIDLIPDFIPGLGFLDDIAVAAFVLNTILNNVDPEIIRKNWAGEGDILEHVRRIVDVADDMTGKGLVRKIINLVRSKLP